MTSLMDMKKELTELVLQLLVVRIQAPRKSVRNVTLKNARRDIVKVNVRRPAPYANHVPQMRL